MGVSLNVDELLAAVENPTITLGGVEYEVKTPTFLERAAIETEFAGANLSNAAEAEPFIKRLCDLVGVPVEPVLELPEEVLTQVVVFFWETVRGLMSPVAATVKSNGQSVPTASTADSSPPVQ